MEKVWKTLDPKSDVVFKMLFADERNRPLLIAFLNAVLRPQTPIVEVEVLNPELPKETVRDKGAVLDLRTRTSNDNYANVEIQLAGHLGFRPRALLYSTRSYSSQLGRGQSYVELKPVVGIFILDFNELETNGYHNVFRLLEEHTHEPLTDHLVLHFLELKKLPDEAADPAEKSLLDWCKFLAAQSDEEREQLAMNDPIIHDANEALERLSADPKAQELARERELAAWNYQREMHLSREEGKAEGKAEGLRDAVLHLCRIFQISLTEQRQSFLDQAKQTQLEELHDSIAQHRRWPDS